MTAHEKHECARLLAIWWAVGQAHTDRAYDLMAAADALVARLDEKRRAL